MTKEESDPRYIRLRRLLVERRVAAGLSQTQLASMLGKPQSYVSKVESGKRGIDVIEFVEYVGAIGVDPMRVLRVVLKED